jgi:hypothetical protein
MKRAKDIEADRAPAILEQLVRKAEVAGASDIHLQMRGPTRPRQGGMAVILMLVLLSIILIYLAANLHSLYSLGRELRLTERDQIRRLQNNRHTVAPALGPAAQTDATRR